MNPAAHAELGIWPVRAEAAPLAMHLQDRLGGELYQPWLQADAALSQRQQFASARDLRNEAPPRPQPTPVLA